MTVQEAIDELNKIEDKSKEFKYFDTLDNLSVELGEIEELNHIVIIK